jgi:uncharacterized damage-inducible protein DinB
MSKGWRSPERGGRLAQVDDVKDQLHAYLRAGREAIMWKLEGLDEYAAHRPMTPTATSLLGIAKHLANIEAGYFGETFGRPFPEPMTWNTADDLSADMWATADESTDELLALYDRACRHADETILSLDLGATGRVPWWPLERGDVSLARILVHVIAETHRHAGQVDIIRELLDGSVGLRRGFDNMAPGGAEERAAYYLRVEHAALAWRDRERRSSHSD